MKLNSPFLTGLGGLLATGLVRGWMSTLDCKVAYYDPAVDPASPQCRGAKIHVFWHEYILFPLAVRGHCNLAMLLSRHRDADVLSRVARHMGFQFVRGSTNRGGATALAGLAAKSRSMHLTITPDGPRGPRRHMAVGPIFLASKLGLPLVATGYGFDRPWRAASWDRFAVPRPFSRARAIPSAEITVPARLDRHGLEHFRRAVEALLNRLTEEAETWASSGVRKAGERVVECRPAGRLRPRQDRPHEAPLPHLRLPKLDPAAPKPVFPSFP